MNVPSSSSSSSSLSSLLFIFFTLTVSCVQALPFRLSSVFGPNMVLQRDTTNPVWGWAKPNTIIYGSLYDTISNVSITVTSLSDASTGLFILSFPPQAATGSDPVHSYSLTVSTQPISTRCNLYAFSCEGTSVTLTGILFGDVLFCTGQSNMQVNVGFAFNSSYELNEANYFGGLVRVFETSSNAQSKDGPLDDLPSPPLIPWSMASNVSLPEYSATCYFTAKSILDNRPSTDRYVPLGLITTTWGGTPIKAWTSSNVNAQCASLYPYPANGPDLDCGLFHAPCNASALFNTMIAPFTVGPVQIAAAVWFQGENDVEEQSAGDTFFDFYACQLRGLITDLRTLLGNPSAPWATVLLAPYHGGTSLPAFRAMQCAATSSLENANCAYIHDGGDPLSPIGDVHSRNKQLVGNRVAASLIPALYNISGTTIPPIHTGPTYLSATVSAASDGSWLYANISFISSTMGSEGLVYVPPHVNAWQNSSRCPTEISPINDAYCDWFNIWGSNGIAYNATIVTIVNNNQLSLAAPVNPPVPNIHVMGTRFGWNQWPVVNFYNQYGLPIVPWNITTS